MNRARGLQPGTLKPPPSRASCQSRFPRAEAFGFSLDPARSGRRFGCRALLTCRQAAMGAALTQLGDNRMKNRTKSRKSNEQGDGQCFGDDQPMSARSLERYHDCYGGIGATVYETRFADGARRYSVVFRRDVSDLALEGPFHSLGQDELMDLVAAASNAYFQIRHLRFLRNCGHLPELPFDQLTRKNTSRPRSRRISPIRSQRQCQA